MVYFWSLVSVTLRKIKKKKAHFLKINQFFFNAIKKDNNFLYLKKCVYWSNLNNNVSISIEKKENETKEKLWKADKWSFF